MFALLQRAFFTPRRADAVGRALGKFRSSLTGKCGSGCSNRAGISNLITVLENMPPYWAGFDEFMFASFADVRLGDPRR
jgi:hypothetical protein